MVDRIRHQHVVSLQEGMEWRRTGGQTGSKAERLIPPFKPAKHPLYLLLGGAMVTNIGASVGQGIVFLAGKRGGHVNRGHQRTGFLLLLAKRLCSQRFRISAFRHPGMTGQSSSKYFHSR